MTDFNQEARRPAPLAPHPWDRYAEPPPVGVPYQVIAGVDIDPRRIKDVEHKTRSMLTLYEEAEDYSERSRQAEDEADDLFHELDGLIDELAADGLHPAEVSRLRTEAHL